MDNEIMEKNYSDVTVSAGDTTIQLSPEASAAVFELGAGLISGIVKSRKEVLLASIEREVELQIHTLEKSVQSQKNVLDMHERNQKELLDHYMLTRKSYLDLIANSKTEEERVSWTAVLERLEDKLENLYLDNNAQLDSGLEKTKQQSKGILGQVLSRLGW